VTGPSNKARRVAPLVLLGGLCACLAFASPVALAKKKGGGGSVNITKPVNLPIPDAVDGGPAAVFDVVGILRSPIDVSKRFQGRRIRDVNVTVQTLGTSGTTPAEDLGAILTAPNGGTVPLFSTLFTPFSTPNPSLGPLTLDDEARLELGSGEPHDPTDLYAPWAGTATPSDLLTTLDNGAVRGTWMLTMFDGTRMETSNLVSWRLQVVAGRPFLTK
jgi:hypothetical protein